MTRDAVNKFIWRMKLPTLNEFGKKEGDLNEPPLDKTQFISDVGNKLWKLLVITYCFRQVQD